METRRKSCSEYENVVQSSFCRSLETQRRGNCAEEKSSCYSPLAGPDRQEFASHLNINVQLFSIRTADRRESSGFWYFAVSVSLNISRSSPPSSSPRYSKRKSTLTPTQCKRMPRIWRCEVETVRCVCVCRATVFLSSLEFVPFHSSQHCLLARLVHLKPKKWKHNAASYKSAMFATSPHTKRMPDIESLVRLSC